MFKHVDEIKRVIEICDNHDRAGAEAETALRERLFDLISKMSPEAQAEMLALMWTGGPKNQNTFEENLALADKTRDENHAEVLSAHALDLSSFLNEGLRKASGSTQ